MPRSGSLSGEFFPEIARIFVPHRPNPRARDGHCRDATVEFFWAIRRFVSDFPGRRKPLRSLGRNSPNQYYPQGGRPRFVEPTNHSDCWYRPAIRRNFAAKTNLQIITSAGKGPRVSDVFRCLCAKASSITAGCAEFPQSTSCVEIRFTRILAIHNHDYAAQEQASIGRTAVIAPCFL